MTVNRSEKESFFSPTVGYRRGGTFTVRPTVKFWGLSIVTYWKSEREVNWSGLVPRYLQSLSEASPSSVEMVDSRRRWSLLGKSDQIKFHKVTLCLKLLVVTSD